MSRLMRYRWRECHMRGVIGGRSANEAIQPKSDFIIQIKQSRPSKRADRRKNNAGGQIAAKQPSEQEGDRQSDDESRKPAVQKPQYAAKRYDMVAFFYTEQAQAIIFKFSQHFCSHDERLPAVYDESIITYSWGGTKADTASAGCVHAKKRQKSSITGNKPLNTLH